MTRSIPNSSIGSRYKNRMLVVGGHDGAKHLRLGQLMLDPGGKPHQVTGIDRSSINMVCVLEAGIPWLVWGLQLECWIYDTHIYIYTILMYIYIYNILYYKYILLYMYTLPVLLSSHFAGCIRIFMASFFFLF